MVKKIIDDPKVALLIILVLSLLTRIFLFNINGAYFFPDEIRYEILHDSLNQSFLQGIFDINGRPGFGLLYLPALIFADYTFAGLVLNIIINITIILFIYLIIKKLANNEVAFLTSLTAIFSIPLITYVKHLLPYDGAFLFILIGVYFLLIIKSKLKAFFAFGLFLGTSFIIYPSHFYYFLPIPILILLYPALNTLSFKKTVLFVISFFLPILLMQLLSLSTHTSYLSSLSNLSGTVTQGDYLPLPLYLKDYILANNGRAGLIMAIFGVILLALNFKKKPFQIIIIYLLLAAAILEVFSDILKSTVLYGRTIRPLYLLFILTFFASSFYIHIPRLKIALVLPAVFLSVLILGSIPPYLSYKNTIFTEDFNQQTSHFSIDLVDVWDYKQSADDPEVSDYQFQKDKVYKENRGIIYPYYGMKKINCRQEILYEKPDALVSFEPYPLEGYDITMRKIITENPPRHQIFKCS